MLEVPSPGRNVPGPQLSSPAQLEGLDPRGWQPRWGGQASAQAAPEVWRVPLPPHMPLTRLRTTLPALLPRTRGSQHTGPLLRGDLIHAPCSLLHPGCMPRADLLSPATHRALSVPHSCPSSCQPGMSGGTPRAVCPLPLPPSPSPGPRLDGLGCPSAPHTALVLQSPPLTSPLCPLPHLPPTPTGLVLGPPASLLPSPV